MKRALAVGLGFFMVGVILLNSLGDADAQRRRRRRGPAKQAAATGYSAEISKTLGDLTWGMNPTQVKGYFEKSIREKYRPQIAKAPGAIEEDRLRTKLNNELDKLRRSYVRFTGQNTGWEVSFVGDEFTHNNGEALLVVNDEHTQTFYFFIGDRLWKRYVAFNADQFAGLSFADFRQRIEARYGPAQVITETNEETGQTRTTAIRWHDDTSYMRAVDNTRFYGVFCLAFEEKATFDNIAGLRRNPSRRPERRNAMIDAVTQGGVNNANADVVDRLTGRRIGSDSTVPPGGARPAQGTTGGNSDNGTGPSQGLNNQSPNRNPSPATDSDPLRGLDL